VTSEVDTRKVERRERRLADLERRASKPSVARRHEEVAQAIAQERAAREQAEAEAERERTLRDWYEHKLKLIAGQTSDSKARKHARYALSTTPEPARHQ
jgi:hypothetical protein